MKSPSIPPIELVITVAMNQELPREWLDARGVARHKLAALQAGALRQVGPGADQVNGGILVVVTGVGLARSRQAAEWIRDELRPRWVLNLGTCAALEAQHPQGCWLLPAYVSNEAGVRLPLDTRLPIPLARGVSTEPGGTLVSVERAVMGQRPALDGPIDCVDMEAHAQAEVFAGAGIAFCVIKGVSDQGCADTPAIFQQFLPRFRDQVQQLLGFLERPALERVSVIIPTYNRAPHLAKAIESVLAQTRPADELIVVDDGSSDHTQALLQGYQGRIETLRLVSNQGVSRARNLGVERARGAWIAFLDSDDYWDADCLASQMAFIARNPFYQALQAEEIWMRHARRVNRCDHHAKPQGWVWRPSLDRCMISPSAVMLRRELFLALGGFDEALPACEDYELWLRLTRRHPLGLNPYPGLIKQGGHPDQLSAAYPAMDRFRVYALIKALACETEAQYQQALRDKLREKLTILTNGALKRGRQARADALARLRAWVEDQQQGLPEYQWLLNNWH